MFNTSNISNLLRRLATWVRHYPIISRRFFVAAALSGLFSACLLFKPGGTKLTADIDNLGINILTFLGAWWCFAAAQKQDAEGKRAETPHRITLLFLGFGVSAYAVGETIWSYYEIVLHQATPFPSWADAGFLAQYPLLLVGILRLPTRRLPPALRWRVVLDSLITLTALVTLSWYFVLGPTLQQGNESLLAKVLGAAYPLGDLVLLVSLLLVMAQRRDSVPRPVVAMLSLGLAGIIVADTVFAYQTLKGTYATGSLGDIGWPVGYLCIGLAAGLSRRRAAEESDDRPAIPLLWRSLLPYFLMPVLAALALYARLHHGDEALEPGVYLGGGMLVLLVLVRQAVAMQRLISDLKERIKAQEKAEELLTALAEQDSLTGLLNHRVFHKRLQEEAEHAERSGLPLMVALIDLNNFKFFNDAYGHLAGDDVLRQAAHAIRDCCRPCDTLARFGGDEFALLLPGAGQDEAGRLATRLQSRLDNLFYYPPDHDVAIPLQLSVGTAVFPEERRGRLETLALADTRLYQAKTGGSDESATQGLRTAFSERIEGFSMLDALVTAVDNKDRYTGRHSSDVMTFSLQLAEALKMDTETKHIVAVAALLHDLGKIGVPDAILRKPGQLSEEEFAAVRHHPVMGAVLVKAVPGFEDTLDAVRFHHERWDGGGYPEGRCGAETPLIARIMAVADAFSAMTTDRPYRKGMTEERALAEIIQGSGTQFDPFLAQTFVSLRQSSLFSPSSLLPQASDLLAKAA